MSSAATPPPATRRTPAACEPLEARTLLSAGDPDPTFDADGRATLDFPGQPFIISDIAVQPGGKVVVAGTKAGNLAVARFNVNGTVDESFGNGGLFESSRWDAAGAVAVQDDGKIVLTLPTNLFLGGTDFLVARVTQNGQNFDTAFGNSGIATVDGRIGRYNEIKAVAVQQDGKIVAAGFAGGRDDEDFVVVRYNADGSLDDSFDGDGVATVGFGADEAAADVAIDYNGDPLSNPFYGTIVLAGHKGASQGNGRPPLADSRFAVARLRPDGSPDNTFDGDGKLTAPAFTGGPNSVGTAVLVQSFGRIVVVGHVGPNGTGGIPDFALARFGADGALDPAFGGNGTGQVETDFGGRPDSAWDVIAGDFGCLMVAGTSDRTFAVAAYTADGVPDTRFGDGTGRVRGLATSNTSATGIAAGPGRRLYGAGGTGTVAAFLDVGPVITVAPLDGDASEAGQDAASFRVVRDEPLSGARRVFFDVSGTARKPGITFPVGRPADYAGDPDTLFPRDDSGEIPYVDIPAGASETIVTITPAQDTLAEGLESAIFDVRPHAADAYDVGVPKRVELTIADDEAPNPAVMRVYADSTAWTGDFRTFLQNKGLGSAALGYRVPTLADQLANLPWTNVNRFRVVFSEDVNVQAGDLRIRGVNTAGYALAAGAAGFSYDPATFTATWTLAATGVGADKLILDLDADAASGGVTARATGNLLDGEWNNPGGEPPEGGDVFPSGNGLAGGDFRFQLNVLPADVNRSGGIVNSLDLQAVRLRQFTSPTNPGTPPNTYTAFHDVNGSAGIINALDVQQVRTRQFTQLPTGNPAMAVRFRAPGRTASVVKDLEKMLE